MGSRADNQAFEKLVRPHFDRLWRLAFRLTGRKAAWIAGTLALRQRKTSLWDVVRQVDLRKHFDRLRPQMLPDEALARTVVWDGIAFH